MKIAIFGVGAMGCLFGAKLSPHADVTLIGHWPEQLAALRNWRLRVIYPAKNEELVDLNATDDLDMVEEVEVVLILTKAVGTEKAAEGAARLLSDEGIAITLQNGLGNLEILKRYVGEDRAALGVTSQGAAIQGPGVLRYGGVGQTHLAATPALKQKITAVAMLFNQAGFPTEVAEDVSPLVWGKLAINCAINPLTAILRVQNGILPDNEWAQAIMHQAAREAAQVADAQGIVLPFPDAAAQAEEVARLTANNRSSMLQDVLRGVPTEIETICGAVMRAGEQFEIDTPVNTMLYRLVEAMEESERMENGK